MDKILLRTIYKEKRDSIKDRREKELYIINKIKENKIFREAKTIAFYMPIKSEVNILSLINETLEEGKIVCLPRVINEEEMRFYKINKLEELEKGSFGIYEPSKNLEVVEAQDIDFIIVPVLIYDENNNRIGYGKGYYDRFLKKAKNAFKAGVAFEVQEYDDLKEYLNEYDVKLDVIFTDKAI